MPIAILAAVRRHCCLLLPFNAATLRTAVAVMCTRVTPPGPSPARRVPATTQALFPQARIPRCMLPLDCGSWCCSGQRVQQTVKPSRSSRGPPRLRNACTSNSSLALDPPSVDASVRRGKALEQLSRCARRCGRATRRRRSSRGGAGGGCNHTRPGCNPMRPDCNLMRPCFTSAEHLRDHRRCRRVDEARQGARAAQGAPDGVVVRRASHGV